MVLKKTALFLFGLSLFLLPGQNSYLVLNSHWRPSEVRAVDYHLPPPSDLPVNVSGQQPPVMSANSVYILDVDSATVLWEKNARQQVLPASTVKIMSALVALEHYRPDDVLTVHYVDDRGQDLGLFKGEQMTFEDLLYASLVSSANDAASVLAQNYPEGEAGFVFRMNEKARELEMEDTYYVNPSGLNDDYFGNLLTGLSLTSARDLSRLTLEAMKNPLFARAVQTLSVQITDVSGNFTYELHNINRLIGQVRGVVGVKTGWTEDAGECLVTYVKRDGRSVLLVVLGSQDRFGESRQLIDWVFGNFQWQPVTLAS